MHVYNLPRTREEQKKILSYIIGSRGVYIDVKEIDFVFYVKRNLCVRVQQTHIHAAMCIYDKKVLAKRNGILYLPIGVRSCMSINTNSTTYKRTKYVGFTVNAMLAVWI